MLIAIIGESCVGKTSLANELKDRIDAKVFSGKDFLKLEKNPFVAIDKFKQLLKESINGQNIIYVIADQEQLDLLPEKAIKIVLTADLNIIKDRFKKRMNGQLPKPVEIMLEKKHGVFNHIDYDLLINNNNWDINYILNVLDIK